METEGKVLWYMPGIFYEEGNTTPMITKLWTKIENGIARRLSEEQQEKNPIRIEARVPVMR